VKRIVKSHDATSAVFATLLLVLLVFAFGIFLYDFVMSNVKLATNTFNTEMASLLLKSFTINSTHLISWVQNTGNNLVKIATVYVNGLIAVVQGKLEIEPQTIQPIVIISSFIKGNTYTVKLQGLFGVIMSFQVTY
jgi:hypothetical protein